MIDLSALLMAMIASMALGLMLMGSVFSMQNHTETQLALDLLEADQLDEQLGAETERLKREHDRSVWRRELRARRRKARRDEGVADDDVRSEDGDGAGNGGAKNSPIPWNSWVSRTYSG